ncbi:N-ethylammeline chlorohydrolase [compost metagenome]
MRPAREPIRSLIYSASDRAVRDVYVGGRQVVRNGEVLTIDVDRACAQVELAQQATLANAPGNDYAKRSVDALSPRVFRTAASSKEGV